MSPEPREAGGLFADSARGSRERLLEPVVAPEQLVPDEEGRRSEDPELPGQFGLLAQTLLVLRRLGARQHAFGIDAQAPQDIRKHALLADVRAARELGIVDGAREGDAPPLKMPDQGESGRMQAVLREG